MVTVRLTCRTYEACTGTTGSGPSPPHILHFRSRALARPADPLSLSSRISNVSFPAGIVDRTRGRGNYQVTEQPDGDSFRGQKRLLPRIQAGNYRVPRRLSRVFIMHICCFYLLFFREEKERDSCRLRGN